MNSEWILVLGANSEIAKATARIFAQAGYNLYLASRNTEELDREVRHLSLRYHVRAQALFFDALDFPSHDPFYSNLSPKPTGLILCFGILNDQTQTKHGFYESKINIDTNYTGAVSILETAAKDFEQRGHGFIVGFSSVAGDRGRQSNYLYGSAKAGLSTYLDGMRNRLFPAGVYVLTVKPGFVDTKMTAGLDLPNRLTAKPAEVGSRVFKAVRKKKCTIYIKPIWKFIMIIIIHIPECIFKRTKL